MDCLFCKIGKGDIPSCTIYENDYVRCFLDINPVHTGHTLIIPKKHFLDNNDISLKYMNEINKASKIVMKMLNDKLKPDGIKVVQNNGIIQEVKHYHLHLIPIYKDEEEKIDVKKVYEILSK